MSDEITKYNPSSGPPKFTPRGPLTGLAAKKAAAEAAAKELEKTGEQEVKVRGVGDMEHRIGIVFDDSGSMGSGVGSKFENAKKGVEEFLRSCGKDNTAVAIYPMFGGEIKLTINLPAVALFTAGIPLGGGTPLLETLKKMKDENPSLTRAIVFSDGQPNNSRFSDYGIPRGWDLVVDTVFIGSSGEDFMRKLAELTGGIFLKFDPSKSNFATAFKYLSPSMRHLLADRSFIDKIEGKNG